MKLDLQRLEVGPWPMNCYLLRCPATGQVAIVDPGADAAHNSGGRCRSSGLLHPLDPWSPGPYRRPGCEVQRITGAPAGHPSADAEAFGLEADFPLMDGMEVEVGRGRVTVAHIPGHTPGSVCLRLRGQAVVGDAVFPGGPGHTATPDALAQSLISLGRTVFRWPNEYGTVSRARRSNNSRRRTQGLSAISRG